MKVSTRAKVRSARFSFVADLSIRYGNPCKQPLGWAKNCSNGHHLYDGFGPSGCLFELRSDSISILAPSLLFVSILLIMATSYLPPFTFALLQQFGIAPHPSPTLEDILSILLLNLPRSSVISGLGLTLTTYRSTSWHLSETTYFLLIIG